MSKAQEVDVAASSSAPPDFHGQHAYGDQGMGGAMQQQSAHYPGKRSLNLQDTT
jgi:hypothetical protein